MEPEKRALPLDRVSVADSGRFIGHASTFDRYAYGDPKRLGWWEQFDKGAFDRAIAEEQDVMLLVNHNRDLILGRTSAGTATLSKDKRGLLVEATLPDTSYGRDLRVSLERGDMRGMSIGFMGKADRWSSTKEGEHRLILDVDLRDVSVVAEPANPMTDAALRASGFIDIRRQRWEEAKERFDRMTNRPPGA